MPLVSVRIDGDIDAGLDRFVNAVATPLVYSAAAAMARVIYAEVKLNTTGSIPNTPGIVTGNLHDAIYWAKDTDASTAERAVYSVSWNKRKAPHGHLLEFGTARMAAFPFVTPAAGKLPEAVKAGQVRMRVRFLELAAGV